MNNDMIKDFSWDYVFRENNPPLTLCTKRFPYVYSTSNTLEFSYIIPLYHILYFGSSPICISFLRWVMMQ